MSEDLWLIVVIVVSTIISSFLAMAETALTRISKVDAITLEDEGRRGAAKLSRLVEHPERFLNPVLPSPASELPSLAASVLGGSYRFCASVGPLGILFHEPELSGLMGQLRQQRGDARRPVNRELCHGRVQKWQALGLSRRRDARHD